MIPLSITPNLDEAPWSDITPDQILTGEWSRVGVVPGGMASGKDVVAIVVSLPDGRQVFAQTSWTLFASAARALSASPRNACDLENP